MSRRTDIAKELRKVRSELDDAKREVAEVSGANGRLAKKAGRTEEAEAALVETHESRKEAWRRVGELERQLTEQDRMLRTLAEQNATLLAVVGVMGIGDLEAEVAS